MADSIYTNLYDITRLQQKIMRYIDMWVHMEKTPVPQNRIIQEMEELDEKSFTVINALNGLLKLGYIRRAITNGRGETGINSSKTKYVQLRRV